MELICNKRISLIAFDLDGTLLNSSHRISEFTLKKILDVMDKGVKVTTSSGRISYMQQEIVAQLGFKGPYIGSNGALIMHSADNSILYSKPIDDATSDRLCAFAQGEGLHLCLQNLTGLYFNRENPRLNLFRSSPQVYILESDYNNRDNNNPTYKVLIYAPEEEKFTALVKFLEGEPELVYSFSEKNLFEIHAAGTDKGRGIKWVADYYGVPLDEVCAFGDYDNDIPIFEKVGLSIAMGNASDNLKAKAMYITDSNDNDGIGKALAAMEGCF